MKRVPDNISEIKFKLIFNLWRFHNRDQIKPLNNRNNIVIDLVKHANIFNV